MNPTSPENSPKSQPRLAICLALAFATLAVYWQVGGFEFTNFDEFIMILKNPIVCSGITMRGFFWAMTTSWFEYWHPVTWLSHMLDCELFGLSAGWHHLVSLGFHVANTLLVFAVLERATGALWRSAAVAALFALHPLHVESVAWVAERKDLLSAFFFLLTLWAYVRYVEESRVQSPKSKVWFGVALLYFALGLMSKPMVVTLPFVLLLMDHWPLRRLELTPEAMKLTTLRPLLREKIPFFGLTLMSCAITYWGVKSADNILSAEKVSWSFRLANVPVSYARYLWKMIWPVDLTAFYPMPDHWPLWQTGGAVLVLVLITLFVIFRARSAPYLVFGWLMFLGMLVPTIGLVPVGFQSIADRYTYVPYIGLFVAVVWGIADSPVRRMFPAALLNGAAAAVLLICAYLTWVQAGHWRNGFTLWTHCLAVDPESVIGHYNLGYVLQHSGRTTEAMEHYRESLRRKPDHLDANLNLGAALLVEGQLQEATNYIARALQIKPRYAKAHANMGLALRELGDYNGAIAQCAEAIELDTNAFGPHVDMARALSAQGKTEEALRHYAEGWRLNPGSPQTLYYFGLELLKAGMSDDAISSLRGAVQLAPAWPDAHVGLAIALGSQRATAEAVAEYREALRLNADLPQALNNLAWILATHPDAALRSGTEAVKLAEHACALTKNEAPVFIGTLAAAYAEAGQFPSAVESARKARELALSLGQKELAETNRKLLQLFEAGQAYREAK